MTRINISKHPSNPGMKVASVSVPVVVGDVPGAIVVRCAHESAVGALAAAAEMAQHVACDPTIGAIVPDSTLDDIAAVHSVALAARAGFPTLHAASLQMTRGQRKLAAKLAPEARTFGGPDDEGAAEVQVSGFFDSIANLAKSVANTIVDYGDPDHWPDWMQKLAKPVARATLDAAAVAVFGPAGPAAVETMINIVDKARDGDSKAQDQLESIAKKALKGDKKAKVLMSAVHAADGSSTAGNSKGELGDMVDDYMAQWGEAFQPGAFGETEQAQLPGQGDDDSGYDDAYYPPVYGPQAYPVYSDDDGYGYQSQQPPPPQLNADGTMWFNVDHWERVPAGGLPGMQQQPYGADPYGGQPYGAYGAQGQPAGYDPNGWPVDASGQPWPQDANGQPMDPSAAQPQQDPGNITNTDHRAQGTGPRALGPRGGGVTITAGAPRGAKAGAGFKGAHDSRGGAKPANSGGALWAAYNHAHPGGGGGGGGGGGRDHRGGK